MNKLLLLLMFAWIFSGIAADDGKSDNIKGLLFFNRFDGGSKANVAAGSSQALENHAGSAPIGIKDEAVSLNKGKWLVFDSDKNINTKEGTICFWVKPNWSYGDAESHCFVYVPFRGGEIAISDGYYEGTGGNANFWFVMPGRGAWRTRECKFVKDKWAFVAVTWKFGKKGMIYFNGKKPQVVKGVKKYPPFKKKPKGKIYLGRDGKNGKRWADCEMDEFAIYGKCLSPKEILALYRKHVSEADEKENAQKRIKKLRNLATTKPVRYDAKGRPLEMRMMFLETPRWSTKDIPMILSRCKKAGFNCIIFNAWGMRGATWPCDDKKVKLMRQHSPDFVPELVRQAHAMDMKVIPYFCITMAPVSTPESYLIKDFKGKPIWVPDRKWGIYGGWGSVFNRKWRQLMCLQVQDFLRKYDVDGVGWDYVRARPDYSKENMEAYKKYFGGRNYRDDTTKNIVGGAYPWQTIEWQETHLLAFLGELKKAVDEVRPYLPIYMFGPSYWPTSSHRLIGGGQGRNMIKALNFGLVDRAFLQYPSLSGKLVGHDYLTQNLNCPEGIIGHISNWQRKTPEELKKGGYSVKSANLDELCARIGAFRKNWKIDGISFYYFRGLDDNQLERLKTTVFKEPAEWPPEMLPPPFKPSPAKKDSKTK